MVARPQPQPLAVVRCRTRQAAPTRLHMHHRRRSLWRPRHRRLLMVAPTTASTAAPLMPCRWPPRRLRPLRRVATMAPRSHWVVWYRMAVVVVVVATAVRLHGGVGEEAAVVVVGTMAMALLRLPVLARQ